MSQNWKYRIQNHTETPPEGVWDRISGALDAEEKQPVNWKNRIQNYTENPPIAVWNNIAEVLDEEAQSKGWVKRLQQYQETPPSFIWQNISNELEGEGAQPAKVISINRRKLVYRLAAAASFAGIVVLSVWMMNKSGNSIKNNSNPVAVNETPKENGVPQQQERNLTPEITNNPNASSDSQEKTTAATVQPALKNTNIKTQELTALADANADEATIADPFENDFAKIEQPNGVEANELDYLNTPNSYVTVTGPDGQSIKVSSKFSKMLGLLNTDGTADKEKLDIIIDQSEFWNARFRQWRDKMLYNNVYPAPDNFMGILELLKVVNEKN